jgi:hypothetical protein
VGNIVNLSDTTANAMEATKIALMNGGTIQIFAGPQPANANTPLSGNTLLVTLAFAAIAFDAPVAGSSVANAIQSGTAIATGIASFARIYEADGVTVVMDVSVGNPSTSPPAYITLATNSIDAGGLISISSLVDSCPET